MPDQDLGELIENMTPEQANRARSFPGSPRGWRIIGPNVFGRKCGHCNFCCIVVPVERPLNKLAGVKCEFLKHKGCSIYRQRPDVCAAWKCAWLYQPEGKFLQRPDLSGYAVDCTLHEIFINKDPVKVIQVWVDKDRPTAHTAPELRAYLAVMAERFRLPAFVETPQGGDMAGEDATILFAPCLTNTGQWEEVTQPMIPKYEMDRLRQERGL